MADDSAAAVTGRASFGAVENKLSILSFSDGELGGGAAAAVDGGGVVVAAVDGGGVAAAVDGGGAAVAAGAAVGVPMPVELALHADSSNAKASNAAAGRQAHGQIRSKSRSIPRITQNATS